MNPHCLVLYSSECTAAELHLLTFYLKITHLCLSIKLTLFSILMIFYRLEIILLAIVKKNLESFLFLSVLRKNFQQC